MSCCCCCCHSSEGQIVGRNLEFDYLNIDLSSYANPSTGVIPEIHAIVAATIDGVHTYVLVGGRGSIVIVTENANGNYVCKFINIDSTYNSHSIVYGNGYFVLATQGGRITYSKDLQNWIIYTEKYTKTSSSHYSICYDKDMDRYVAVGYDHKVSVFKIVNDKITDYETDQNTYTTSGSDGYVENQIRFIIYDDKNKRYVAVGENNKIRYCSSSLSNTDVTNFNKKWTDCAPTKITHPNGTTYGFQSIVYNKNDDIYVVVGNDGIIIYNDKDLNPENWRISDSGLYDNALDYATKKEQNIRIELQGISYDYINKLYVCAGWNNVVLYTDDLTKRWNRSPVFGQTKTSYQFVINDVNGKILIAGGNAMMVNRSVSDVIRPSGLTNELLNKMMPLGFQIKRYSQYNPYNMYFFGSWIEDYDSSTKIFTYTRIA